MWLMNDMKLVMKLQRIQQLMLKGCNDEAHEILNNIIVGILSKREFERGLPGMQEKDYPNVY